MAADAGPASRQRPRTLGRTRDEDRASCIYPPGRDSRNTERTPSPRERLAPGRRRLLWRLANCSFEFATAAKEDHWEQQQRSPRRFRHGGEEVRRVIGAELREVLFES